MAKSQKEKKQTQAIIDWLTICVLHAEAGGYEEECFQGEEWNQSVPPQHEATEHDQFFVRYEGWYFLVKVSRQGRINKQQTTE